MATLVFTLVITFSSGFVFAQQLEDWGTTPGQPNYCVVDGVPTLKCLEIVYGNLLVLSSAVLMLILFIMMVYGGGTILLSMGESTKLQKGTKILKWAFIGVGVYVSSYLILYIIDYAFLGGQGKIFKLNIPGP